MNDKEYLQQAAFATGLQYYPAQNPWGGTTGSAIGTRDNYVVAVGLSRERNAKKVVLLFRFKKVADPAMLKASLAQSPSMPPKKFGKLATVGVDFARWEWAYSFSKPNVQEIATMAEALKEALKTLAPPFDGKCEQCNFSSTQSITMIDNLPGYICSGCQQKMSQERDMAAMQYEAIEPNYPNGLVLGMLASFLGGIAWGGIAYGIHRIFLYGAILIGYLVSKAVIKGTRKVTLFGQIVVPILTVASVLFGDVIFFTLTVMKVEGVPYSSHLLGLVLNNFFALEKEGSGILTVIFALAGAGYALYAGKRPKFKATFQPLDAPGRPVG